MILYVIFRGIVGPKGKNLAETYQVIHFISIKKLAYASIISQWHRYAKGFSPLFSDHIDFINIFLVLGNPPEGVIVSLWS